MQALIEFIAGFGAMLAAATLSLFGDDLDWRQTPQREIHRVRDCGDSAPATVLVASADRTPEC
jgi:hypothetical protein